MAKALTTLAIEKMKPGQARKEIADGGQEGLYLVIQPSGKKSFATRTRVNGKPIKITLEAVPPDIAKARKEAAKLLVWARQGRDPRDEIKREKANTFGAACEKWLEEDQEGKTSYPQVKSIMDRVFLPTLKDRPLAAITRSDLIPLMKAEAKRAPKATKVQTAIQRMFKWLVQHDIAEANPARDLPTLFKSKARERTLEPDELAIIWQAAGEDDFADIVRLLILTGARRTEVSDMAWSELSDDLSLWTLPGSRTKNGLAHEVPLPDQARMILAKRAREAGRDLIFGTGEKGFSGFSKCKERLDQRAARIRAAQRIGRPLKRDERPEPEDALTPWTLHDLRRTAATQMAERGTQPHIVEAVLNHISGAKAGIAGVYNKARYRKEKREALQHWGEFIESVTSSGEQMAD